MKPADASKTSNACCGFCNTLAVAQVRLRVCACNLQEAQSLDSTLSIPQDAVEFGVCSARGDPIYSLCIPRTSLTTEAAVLHTLPILRAASDTILAEWSARNVYLSCSTHDSVVHNLDIPTVLTLSTWELAP